MINDEGEIEIMFEDERIRANGAEGHALGVQLATLGGAGADAS
jgi:hypothetical protein